MADKENRRIRPSVLQEDIAAFAALQALTDYDPSNKDYELTKVIAAKSKMDADQTAEVQKNAAADAQRDETTAAEWKLHDLMLGVKDQVRAQYGASSNEFASLGMKKKTEYKSGSKKSGDEAKK